MITPGVHARAAAIQAAVILRGAAAPTPKDDDDFAELFELSDRLAKYIVKPKEVKAGNYDGKKNWPES